MGNTSLSKKQEYYKKWAKENKEARKRYMCEYCKENRESIAKQKKEYMDKYRSENPWLKHYSQAKQRCANSNRASYPWYGGKGIRMLLTKIEAEILYQRDKAGLMKQPSIDRINPNGDYHFGNCRFIELSENQKRKKTRRK